MRLLDSGVSLIASGEVVLGVVLLGVVIAAPALFLTLLLLLHGALLWRPRAKMLPLLGRMLYEVEHWNMVEVFVVGVLVSLTKLASMATVSYGLSFWTYLAFAACLVVAGNAVDRHALWRAIGAGRDAR